MRMLVYSEDIRMEEKRSLSRQSSVLDFLKSLQGLALRHLYCSTVEMMIQMIELAVQEEVPPT
jgi:hypothetical protein